MCVFMCKNFAAWRLRAEKERKMRFVVGDTLAFAMKCDFVGCVYYVSAKIRFSVEQNLLFKSVFVV